MLSSLAQSAFTGGLGMRRIINATRFPEPGGRSGPQPSPKHIWRGPCHVALTLTDLARRLRELIIALDRRRPRAGDAGEPAIARDAADLREKAVNRLAEIGDPATSSTDLPPDRRS
jgi:hypothetical protein